MIPTPAIWSHFSFLWHIYISFPLMCLQWWNFIFTQKFCSRKECTCQVVGQTAHGIWYYGCKFQSKRISFSCFLKQLCQWYAQSNPYSDTDRYFAKINQVNKTLLSRIKNLTSSCVRLCNNPNQSNVMRVLLDLPDTWVLFSKRTDDNGEYFAQERQ